MNKIEIAISDIKLRIEGLEQNRIILSANIDLLKEQLYALKKIERDKSIPHSNPMNEVKQPELTFNDLMAPPAYSKVAEWPYPNTGTIMTGGGSTTVGSTTIGTITNATYTAP